MIVGLVIGLVIVVAICTVLTLTSNPKREDE